MHVGSCDTLTSASMVEGRGFVAEGWGEAVFKKGLQACVNDLCRCNGHKKVHVGHHNLDGHVLWRIKAFENNGSRVICFEWSCW
jgi:hypothetical protein